MVINGNLIKEALLEELAAQLQGKERRVCFVQFGTDAASTTFVKMKMKAASELGIHADHIVSDVTTTEEALLVFQEVIIRLLPEGGQDKKYDGVVLQLPTPSGIDSEALIQAIPLEMDIDVLSDAAMQAFSSGKSQRMPPVAAAIEIILKLYNISPEGKNIVIRGKGKLVGQPIMKLFDLVAIPYEAIDIHTPEEAQLSLLMNADIIISGIGVPHSLTPDMITEGVVLIDAGTSEQGQTLQGDIDPACADKASLYTPVPGGIGPITVACLFKNLLL